MSANIPSVHTFRWNYIDPSISEGILATTIEKITTLTNTQSDIQNILDDASKKKEFLDEQFTIKKRISDLGGALRSSAAKIVKGDLEEMKTIQDIMVELELLKTKFDTSIDLDTEKKEVMRILREAPPEILATWKALDLLMSKKSAFARHIENLRDPLRLFDMLTENEGRATLPETPEAFSFTHEVSYTAEKILSNEPDTSATETGASDTEAENAAIIMLTAEQYEWLKREYHELMNTYAKLNPQVRELEKKQSRITKDITEKNRTVQLEREIADMMRNYEMKRAANPTVTKSSRLLAKETQLKECRKILDALDIELHSTQEALAPLAEQLEHAKNQMNQIRVMLLLSEHENIQAPEPSLSYINTLEMHRRHPMLDTKWVVAFAGHGENIHLFCSGKSNNAVMRDPNHCSRDVDLDFIHSIPLVEERQDAFLKNKPVNGLDDNISTKYAGFMAALIDEPRTDIKQFPNSIGWAWRLHDLSTMFAREWWLLASYLGTTWSEVVKQDDGSLWHTGYPQERADRCIAWVKKMLDDGYALSSEKWVKSDEKADYKRFLSKIIDTSEYSLFVALSRFVVDLPLTHIISAFLREQVDIDSSATLTSHRDDVMGGTDAIVQITKLRDSCYYYLLDFSFRDKSSHLRKHAKIPDFQRANPGVLRKWHTDEPYDFYLWGARRVIRAFIDWYWGCVEQFSEVHDDWIIAKLKSLDTERAIIWQIETLIAESKH